jgi:monofunctional biosynthetic peptidoglycan transglycosylase
MAGTDHHPVSFWKILLLAGVSIVLVSVLMVLPWRWIAPPTTAFMLVEQWQTDSEPAYHWIDWEDIHPDMAIAVVAAEDQKFPDHYGFDLESIQEALNAPGDRPRGASTISQQVAKNLFLWNGRSYVRKGIEAWFTVLIVGAAGALLLDKYPRDFSLHDCSVLAAILPSPKKMSAAEPSAYVRKRAGDIQRQISRLGGTSYLDKL